MEVRELSNQRLSPRRDLHCSYGVVYCCHKSPRLSRHGSSEHATTESSIFAVPFGLIALPSSPFLLRPQSNRLSPPLRFAGRPVFEHMVWRAGARSSEMGKEILGLLKVRVLRGVDLAVRDLWSSDPYVIVKMGKQKLKTDVIKRTTNPVWNEELTLVIDDPTLPVRVEVFDKDTFTLDDRMGNAEFDICALVEAVKMNLEGLPDGTIITKLVPRRHNCLADESLVYWSNGTVLQDLILRLRNVECGELELNLLWVSVPGSRGL